MDREKYLKMEIERITYKVDKYPLNNLDDFNELVNLLNKLKNELKILLNKNRIKK